MANVLEYLPKLHGEELYFIQHLMKSMSQKQARRFADVYSARRQEPSLIGGLAAIGFLGFAGIHRFLLGQIGLGIVYFLTWGFFGIGTIVDLITFRNIAFKYNRVVAEELYPLIRTME